MELAGLDWQIRLDPIGLFRLDWTGWNWVRPHPNVWHCCRLMDCLGASAERSASVKGYPNPQFIQSTSALNCAFCRHPLLQKSAWAADFTGLH